ncbi:MAG: hypothetical protein IPL49_01320 [Saprospirales bacterium]|nr:hypothetical protein [Saprospirales bacterium]MBK8489559.1 hypothetical protein [Saprospirales bacterium]
MKQLLFGLLFVSIASLTFAQSDTPEKKASEVTEILTQKYQLSKTQQDKMHKIQLRRYRDRELIVSNKATDQALYLEQLKAIEHGTDISIQMLLTEAQTPLYRDLAIERREKRAELAQSLLSKGIQIQEVEISVLELE